MHRAAIPLSSPLRRGNGRGGLSAELPFGGFIQEALATARRRPSGPTSLGDVRHANHLRGVPLLGLRAGGQWIANELRRDTAQLRQNDQIGVSFDTFYDRRSGFAFYTNPLGARADYSIVDEGAPNSDWNPVWE
jgi:hypothetical protein